jgi:hypothetical protein
MNQEKSRFKALPIGAYFVKDTKRYRKISEDRAFEIKPNGRGRVHAKIAFARNTNCLAEKT